MEHVCFIFSFGPVERTQDETKEAVDQGELINFKILFQHNYYISNNKKFQQNYYASNKTKISS